MTFWHFNFAFFIALNCFHFAHGNHIIKQYGKNKLQVIEGCGSLYHLRPHAKLVQKLHLLVVTNFFGTRRIIYY
jgi:hypothetical protein